MGVTVEPAAEHGRGQGALMKQEPISSRLEDLDDHYDVVVVGSGVRGVGGRVAPRARRAVGVRARTRARDPARRLPRHARRGRRRDAGEHRRRDTSAIRARSSRSTSATTSACSPAVGLGGTSLINANVSLEADPRVFERGWPQALRDDVDGGLADGIARARTMLGANPLPDDADPGEADRARRGGRRARPPR